VSQHVNSQVVSFTSNHSHLVQTEHCCFSVGRDDSVLLISSLALGDG